MRMLQQRLYNIILYSRQDTFFQIFLLRILKKIEHFILLQSVPVVKATVFGTELSLPWTHQLPRILQQYPGYSSNLKRITTAVHRKNPAMTLVDIGANIGDTVMMVRTEAHFPILCIEGDRYFYRILEQNLSSVKDVWAHCAFVGADDGEMKGSLHRHSGSGSLVEHEDDAGIIPLESVSSIIRKYPNFAAPTILKIDTDGFDCIILRGCSKILAASHPVLFFEYDPYFLSHHGDDGLSIFPFLAQFGYTYILVYDNFGEYLCSVSCTDTRLLEELHRYITDQHGEYYYDLCLLHQSETELFETIRSTEMKLNKQ